MQVILSKETVSNINILGGELHKIVECTSK